MLFQFFSFFPLRYYQVRVVLKAPAKLPCKTEVSLPRNTGNSVIIMWLFCKDMLQLNFALSDVSFFVEFILQIVLFFILSVIYQIKVTLTGFEKIIDFLRLKTMFSTLVHIILVRYSYQLGSSGLNFLYIM